MGELRSRGDPEADAVIRGLNESGRLDAVNRVLGTLVKNEDLPPPDDLPRPVREYLDESSRLPDWADPDKIEIAEHVFMLYGLTAYGVLAHASLPECYVTPSIAEALSTTQRMTHQAHRRILETSHFVLGVMGGGGLEPGGDGRGIRMAQKVRLMHASIRFLILHEPEDGERMAGMHPMQRGLLGMRWDVGERGLPINQADLLRTLLTFSFVVLRGWRALGVRLDAAEEEAYIHCWNVVGHIMGIDFEPLPESYGDCELLFDELKGRWQGDTEAGRLLTAALLRFIKDQLPFALRGLPPVLLRRLVGKQTAAQLGVGRPNPLRWVINGALVLGLKFVNRRRRTLYDLMPSIRMDREWISRRLLERVLAVGPEWRENMFEIPERLADRWELRPPWGNP